MQFDWKKISYPIIALAPMADMTDSPYCQIIKMVSSPKIIPLIFREMVSSEAIVRGNDKSMMMTEIHDSERPLIQQIFGSNPEIMAESAKIIEKSLVKLSSY